MLHREEFGITMNKEADTFTITRKGANAVEEYYLHLVENTGLNPKHLFKSGYYNGMHHLCMKLLDLFKEMDESVEDIIEINE